ncbi:acyl-CoA dehydrogenase family protein [Dactylosporangium sp. NPDC051485]|uniref:acyl-CoA dehydrogenase family protein n=1 Tax=Dactylosporangium sp. NPDC051485 TaxID=3154846 RepID=UPI00341E99E6
MDALIELTAEQEQFRAELCELLCQDAVRDEVARSRRLPYGQETGLLDVHRRLGERGLLAVNWPVEYGGRGGTIVEKAILTEELILHGVPDTVHTLGIDIVGLAVFLYGTPEQRARLLPGLARGDTTASVLFSEPGIGSDLASLTTRAEPDGDGWRLYGRKRYSMKTHQSDFALCAARTSAGPVAYHGITLFLVPLRSVGVHIDPLWNLSEERFDDVTLDGIRVTRADVLGEVDDGWQVVNRVLPLERTGIDSAAKADRLLDALLRQAAATGRLTEPAYAQRLLDLDARVRAARLLAWRCVLHLRDGRPDEVDSATAKWYASEVAKELAGLALEVTGLDGVLDARDAAAVADGVFDAALREAPGLTLAAGTSEIMLYFVGTSGLGLPS